MEGNEVGWALGCWREVARVAGSCGMVAGGSCLEAPKCAPVAMTGVGALGWRWIDEWGVATSDVEEMGSMPWVGNWPEAA